MQRDKKYQFRLHAEFQSRRKGCITALQQHKFIYSFLDNGTHTNDKRNIICILIAVIK
jgi:hypothetical protein